MIQSYLPINRCYHELMVAGFKQITEPVAKKTERRPRRGGTEDPNLSWPRPGLTEMGFYFKL